MRETATHIFTRPSTWPLFQLPIVSSVASNVSSIVTRRSIRRPLRQYVYSRGHGGRDGPNARIERTPTSETPFAFASGISGVSPRGALPSMYNAWVVPHFRRWIAESIPSRYHHSG